MNKILFDALKGIPKLVIAAQKLGNSTGMTGADKAALVINTIKEVVPEGDNDKVDTAMAFINDAVSFFNMVHPLWASAAAAVKPPVT